MPRRSVWSACTLRGCPVSDIRKAGEAVTEAERRVRSAIEDLRRATRARDELIGATLTAEFGPGLVVAGRGWIVGRANLKVRCRDDSEGWEAFVSTYTNQISTGRGDTPRAACAAAIAALPRGWEADAVALRVAVSGEVAATTWSKH